MTLTLKSSSHSVHGVKGKSRHTYHCAQYEGRQTPSEAGKTRAGKKPPGASRARDTMDRFACEGWLYVTLLDDSPEIALVSIKHKSHVPYTDISIPPEVKVWLEQNKEKTASAVCLVSLAHDQN